MVEREQVPRPSLGVVDCQRTRTFTKLANPNCYEVGPCVMACVSPGGERRSGAVCEGGFEVAQAVTAALDGEDVTGAWKVPVLFRCPFPLSFSAVLFRSGVIAAE